MPSGKPARRPRGNEEIAVFCTKCGANLNNDAKFCAKCGTAVAGDLLEAATLGPDGFQKTATSVQSAPSTGKPAPNHDTTGTLRGALANRQQRLSGAQVFKITIGMLVVSTVGAVLVAKINDRTPQATNASSPAALAAASQASERAATDQLLDKVWHAYVDQPGNSGQGARWLNVQGEMVKTGTVSPKTMSTAFEGRLPAYLACYTFVEVLAGLGDQKGEMCIFLVLNDEVGTQSVMWRGKQNMGELEQTMTNDDFQPFVANGPVHSSGSVAPPVTQGGVPPTATTVQSVSEFDTRHGAARQADTTDVGAPASAATMSKDVRAATNGTVRAFYDALSRGSGEEASALVVPEKRQTGPYSAQRISHFYGGLTERLQLLDLAANDTDGTTLVRYRYIAGNARCEGRAIVTTVPVGQQVLIQRIQPLDRC